MVGRFAGWLIYFTALPNWVSIFQNSTGSSSITSFTLQDCTFPVAWLSIYRKCLSCSIWTILYLSLHLRSHLPGCLFLKYTLSPILKEGGVLSIVFCVVLKWFLSNVSLAMANAGLHASCSAFQNLGLPRIVAWFLVADVEVNLDPFCILRRMGFLLWLGKEWLCSWLELDLYIYPSWMGPFHITSSG